MNDFWYPITDHHPAPLVQVRGIVEVRSNSPFDAHLIISRGQPPRTSLWAEWVKGKALPLGPGVYPKYWQPQRPDKWMAPLPPPAHVSASGIMWSEGMRFQAVEEAEAAELARDMERDREMARNGSKHIFAASHKPEQAWWRDVSLIRYEPAGAVTEKMAEGRVMRAVALCGHGQGLTIRVSTFGDILARMIKADPTEPDFSDYIPRLQAFPQDHGDFLTAMSWFVALNPPPPRFTISDTWEFNKAQLCLHYRSLNDPLSFDEIGGLKEIRMSGENARKLYASTIKRITAIANQEVAIPAFAQIESLRERNRQARNAA